MKSIKQLQELATELQVHASGTQARAEAFRRELDQFAQYYGYAMQLFQLDKLDNKLESLQERVGELEQGKVDVPTIPDF